MICFGEIRQQRLRAHAHSMKRVHTSPLNGWRHENCLRGKHFIRRSRFIRVTYISRYFACVWLNELKLRLPLGSGYATQHCYTAFALPGAHRSRWIKTLHVWQRLESSSLTSEILIWFTKKPPKQSRCQHMICCIYVKEDTKDIHRAFWQKACIRKHQKTMQWGY